LPFSFPHGPSRPHLVPEDEPDVALTPSAVDDPVFATKALRKFLSHLTSRESPCCSISAGGGEHVISSASNWAARFSSRNIFADVDRHVRDAKLEQLPDFSRRVSRRKPDRWTAILCWDLIDYLDRAAAQELATELTRVLRRRRAARVLGTAQPRDTRYTKFIIGDEANLKHRTYPAARGQAILLNRDIIRLFPACASPTRFSSRTTARILSASRPTRRRTFNRGARRISDAAPWCLVSRGQNLFVIQLFSACSACSALAFVFDKLGGWLGPSSLCSPTSAPAIITRGQ